MIASGGIGSIEDLISLFPLEKDGVEGVIVGRALYDGKVDLKEAIVVMKNSSMQDAVLRKGFFA